mgnify:CR=1 FL=1
MGRIISIVLAIAVFMTLTFPLRASGGELDGKSIHCSFRANWGKGIWLGDSWGVSFENGKAVTLFVDDTYPPKIKRATISEYVVDEHQKDYVITVNKDDIKIFGNPNLKLNKNIHIKNYFKDHRVFMMSCIAALSFGGTWKIDDKDSINTFSSANQPLGYPFGPSSDLISISSNFYPSSNIYIKGSFNYYRKGSGLGSSLYQNYIERDPDLDNDTPLLLKPITYNKIITLMIEYKFSRYINAQFNFNSISKDDKQMQLKIIWEW